MTEQEKTKWGKITSFRHRISVLCRVFLKEIKRGEEVPQILAENADRLCIEVLSAKKKLLEYRRLPLCRSGEPYIYMMAKSYWKSTDGALSHASLHEYCERMSSNHSFYDEELLLLSSSLVISAIDLYDETKNEGYLNGIFRLSDVDFESIYYLFSEVERVFLTETAMVYAHCDVKTRRLYHARLQLLISKTREDAIDAAKRIVAAANRRHIHIGEVLKPNRGISSKLYFYFLTVLTLLLTVLYAVISDAGFLNLILIPMILLPIYGLVKEFLIPFFTSVGEKTIPKLMGGEVFSQTKVLVVIATLLFGEEKDASIFDRLEDFYLTNGSPTIRFAVLGDLPQSEKRTADKDGSTIQYATMRVKALQAKYGDHFALFIRGRRRCACESSYIGWERKRGGVLELCRFLRGDKTSIQTFLGDRTFLSEIRYLVTLDADTNLAIGAVREMVGAMLHPENRPVLDPARGCVTSGHAVLAPRMITSLSSASVSPFSRLSGGAGGVDVYAGTSSDLYQQVFDEGSFCGKGILDVDAYLSVCDGFFPNERILSHDLVEGNLLRSGLAGDIVLSDSTPKNARSYYARLHRWLRGDLQILPYLRRRIRNTKGEAMPNPMSRFSKFKIFDNVMRGAMPLFSLLAILMSFFGGEKLPLITTVFALSYLFSPVVLQFFTGLYYRNLGTAARRFYSVTLPHFLDTVAYAAFRISALPYEAYLFADASIRTGYRFRFSHRNFLNWTTAAQGDHDQKGGLDDYVRLMWPSMAVGILFFFLPLGVSRFLGLLWLLFPFAMCALSSPFFRGGDILEKTKEDLIGYAQDAWRYFRDLVNEETNHLPPDNIQFSPVERTAMRTSPTNIGLYLLAVLAARDFDFITSAELCSRVCATLHRLSHMLVWHGHFYNWYDIRTLEVIGEPFVSTVDSGNLITALVTLAQGLKEYVWECPALLDAINMSENFIRSADFRMLYDERRRLFRIGYHVKTGRYSDSCYDTLMSESRTTSYFATAMLAVPREHYFSLSRQVVAFRGEIGIASWSGTAFEYFMPHLLLPVAKNSLSDESLAFAYKMQKRSRVVKDILGKRRELFGISESGYFGFDYEMNYQYRAFGVDRLALDPAACRGRVIAPYAGFLMLERDPQSVSENLKELHSFGIYGKYGFYEAIDFDSSRVGEGYAIIKSYMAHHLGMTILSVANAAMNGIFRERFMKDPAMRASRELLEEKIPVAARSVSRKRKQNVPPSLPRFSGLEENEEPKYEHNLIYPEVALVSNNKTKILASSSGHVELTDGTDVLFGSDFDRYSLGGGLRVYANIDGEVFSAVPLSREPDGFSGEFDFIMRSDAIEYRSRHVNGSEQYKFCVRFSVFANREIAKMECFLSGTFRRAFVQIYFEPILDKRANYEAHRSFSDLFLESRYDEDDAVLIFSRRPRNDKKTAKLLGVTVVPSPKTEYYDTMRDRILPLAATERDFAQIPLSRPTGATGALIVPACSMRSDIVGAKRGKVCFFIGRSTDADDLLYLLARCRSENGKDAAPHAMGDILNLQYSAAGLRKSPSAWERYLLRGMCFYARCDRGERETGKIDMDCFWRHSISGENKMVLAKISSDNEEQKGRLFDLIRLFKYMCIRGVRYDFVILYSENDHYHAPLRRGIETMIRDAGCENFLAWTGGIFLIPMLSLSAHEQYAYEKMSCAVFDLSVPLSVTACAEPCFVPISAQMEQRLKQEPSTRIFPSMPPEREVIARVHGGFFHERGFVCEKPHGRSPFAHVIASENFGTIITENSLGFTYSRNAGLRKLTPHDADSMREDRGERLLLRIYDRFDRERFEDYDMIASSSCVDYTFGAAEYYGEIEGIFYRVVVNLVGKFDGKRIAVFLKNIGKEEIPFCLAYLVSPALGERKASPSFYRFRTESSCMIHISRLALGMEDALVAMNRDADAVYTDRAAFASDGKLFSGISDIAVICLHNTLVSSFETSFYLVDYVFSHTFAYLCSLCFSSNVPIYRPDPVFSQLRVRTSMPLFDVIVNDWSLYQTIYARIFARSGYYQVSGAFGFRDQLQDVLSLISVMPQMAKVVILRAAAHQYEDGSVQHWWHPGANVGIMTRCSDDFLWLPYVVSEYVLVTGDEEILEKKIAYLHAAPLAEGEEDRYEKAERSTIKESLFSHMLRAVKNGMRRGVHGLPLMGSCDWNDGMNLVGKAGKGESVWLAFFTALVFRRMSRLCRLRGECELSQTLEREALQLLHAVETCCYDGAWYIRGFYDDGSPLGSAVRTECKIDALPQAFSMICAKEFGIDDSRAKTAMESLYQMLYDREHRLVRLLTPPFHADEQSPGYIKGYVSGIRENGGQYTHAAVWASLGFFAGEENERGAEMLFAINPAMRCADPALACAYRIEPYVLAGDIYSNPMHEGRGGWSWYTGSASWYRKVALEILCGYREENGGFRLMPHLSSRFQSFSLVVSRQETVYHIIACLSEKDELTLDGAPIFDLSHRFLFDGGHHEIVLRQGEKKKRS